jgi:hypothetical protein
MIGEAIQPVARTALMERSRNCSGTIIAPIRKPGAEAFGETGDIEAAIRNRRRNLGRQRGEQEGVDIVLEQIGVVPGDDLRSGVVTVPVCVQMLTR